MFYQREGTENTVKGKVKTDNWFGFFYGKLIKGHGPWVNVQF